MKKIYTLTAASLIFLGIDAQQISFTLPDNGTEYIRKSENVQPSLTNNFSPSFKTDAAVDTAGIEFTEDQLIFYTYSTDGTNKYVMFGNNSAADKEIAQVYPYFGSGISIESILVRFGYKAGSASLNAKVYNVVSSLPSGAAISSTSVNLTNVDTVLGHYTVITPSSPVNVTSHFAVAIDVSPLYNLTALAGLLVTKQDEPHATVNGRIKWSDDTWHGLGESWNTTPFVFGITNCNMMILPVVSAAYNLGINETQEVNGIKLTQSYPNPTKDFAKIEYQIKDAANIYLELIDVTGKTVLTQQAGKQQAGKHEMLLNVSQLPAGTYFYSLNAGDKRLAKQLVINK